MNQMNLTLKSYITYDASVTIKTKIILYLNTVMHKENIISIRNTFNDDIKIDNMKYF